MLEHGEINHAYVLHLARFLQPLEGEGGLFEVGNRIEVVEQEDVYVIGPEFFE